jgi:hypothetical protein
MPVQVDVFSPMPESWGLCQSCETLMSRAEIKDSDNFRGLEAYPPDWYEDFQRLSDAVLDLAHRYGESVNIRLYDPRSLPGPLQSYPAWRPPLSNFSHLETGKSDWVGPARDRTILISSGRQADHSD